jgi:hypothetical protein
LAEDHQDWACPADRVLLLVGVYLRLPTVKVTLSSSFASPDDDANEPKRQKNHRNNPKEMQSKPQPGEDKNHEKCQQQEHYTPLSEAERLSVSGTVPALPVS